MTTITLELNDDDNQLFTKFAEIYGMTISDFAKKSMIERIEDEIDLKSFNQSLEDEELYTLDEVKKELGL